MASRSLATKLSVPTAPRDLVQRQRLLARVDEGAVRRLTLVSAPAGSGKTTLLAHFASATRLPVAWVSLDERDDNPHRFWSCVVGALARLRPDSEPPALSDVADDALLEWVDEVMLGIPSDFLLVLDDYHQIASAAVHRGVAFLLDYAPPTMHLAIATRRDPPLPLGVLRARDQLIEIRAGDLSFTSGESASLLQAIVGPALPPEAVEALHESTEGWAASLQLAGVAMRGRPNPLEVARTFSGTHRYVVDYLADEVLLRQPPDLRQFLLETSILDRLCGPLCDAVTGSSTGRETLEALERGNLLLVPLGEDRYWYRYHHLFADFLRAHLGSESPDRLAELHRRAASWLERQGDTAEAFEHWLAAGDAAGAAAVVERIGRDLLNRGELRLIAAWLERLPTEAVLSRPWLSLYRAWALTLSGEKARAERLVAEVETRLAEAEGLTTEERRALKGEATAIRAFTEARLGEPHRARELAGTALEQLPESAQATRSIVYLALGLSDQLLDDLAAAESGYQEALAIARESENYHVAFPAIHGLVDLMVRRGRLHEAMALCEEALHPESGATADSLPVSAELHRAVADILYHWNDLGNAAEVAERAVTLSRRWGLPDAMVRCRMSLATICRARGHHERARSLAADVERLMVGGGLRQPSQTEQDWAGFRLRWWVTDCQIGRAASLAVELGLNAATPSTSLNVAELLGFARLLLAEGRAGEASALLDRLARYTAAAGRVGRQIEARVLVALALAGQRNLPAALAPLREALVLAEPEGYVRVFLDEGSPLARLLEQARGALEPAAANYARRLLAAFGEVERGHAKPPGLAEPLSRRELQILELIARGKTYQEIARELIVAVSTVQHHVRSLYPKLDAHSGLEAVARARQLGLLP